MSALEKAFAKALEAYEDLLAKERRTLDDHDIEGLDAILSRKDEALQTLLESRDALGQDPRSVPALSDALDRVLEAQESNARELDAFAHSRKLEQKVARGGRSRLRQVLAAYGSSPPTRSGESPNFEV